MYLEHFGLTEVPFRITPHTEFFFSGANRGATLEALIYAIIHDEGIVKVSGEVGSGKTMLCRVLMERLPPNVVIVYLANPSLSRDDILFAIADDLDLKVPDNARTSVVLRTLHNKLIELHGQGRQVVVLIDEAHAMPMETLEEVRLLSNLETSQHKLLQLVMFGQPELDAILARPDMRQLKERITQNFSLEPMRREDIAEYLEFRMRTAGYRGPQLFSPAATKLIASASLGLTRRINILAEKSLLAAFAAGLHEITPKEVDAAIKDTEYDVPQRGMRRRVAWVSVTVVALLAVAATIVTRLPSREVAAATPVVTPAAKPSPSEAAPLQTTAEPAPVAVETVSTNMPAPAPAAGAQSASSSAGQSGVPPSLTFAQQPAGSDKLAATEAKLRPGAATRLRETREWIAAANGRHWFIQLVSTNGTELDYAQNYLAMADRLLGPEHARLYMADTGKEHRIGIIFGEYPTMSAANMAIEQLPEDLRRNNPFPRQVLWLK